MKRYLSGLVLLFLFIPSVVWAQRGTRLYDVKSETKVTGTVEDVQQFTGRHGWAGVHLTLKTDAGTVDVHAGPAAYLEKQQFSFAKGDSIEVVGSQIKQDGKDVMLAREITKDGKTLSLRNKNGLPLWSGGARRANY